MIPIAPRALPLLVVSLALAACDPPASPVSTAGPSAAPAPPPPVTSASTASTTSTAPAPPPPVAAAAPAPLAKPAATDELARLARSNNAFALDFYGKVRAQKGNLAISPFSISTALDLTWAGAKAETASQMAKVLHLDGPPDRTLDVAGSLVASYGAPDQKVTVRIANRLFGEQTFAFEQPYLTRVKSAFGAPLEPLDFKNAAEDGRKHINGWVAGQTQDRIKDLIPPLGVDKTTALVLVNAIYLLGEWATPFKKESTTPAPFFTGKSDKKDVLTMHQDDHLRFAATDGVKLLELPYQNGALGMDFVLPDAVDGLDALEARLTPAALDRWLGAASAAHVDVSLPRIEIAPATSLSVGDTLSSLGMPLAFDSGKADFTGIGKPPNPAERLYISRVFHKAFVKIDEKGTEAAAATAVVMAVGGAAPLPEARREFKADHPFLFFLRDLRSGLVLFMGRVADPASK